MRNEFVGDARDHLKYTLLHACMMELSDVDRLTFLPLMQPDQAGGHGLVRLRRTKADDWIADFLEHCLADGSKSIFVLEQLFASAPYAFHLFRPSTMFSAEERDEYFGQIPDQWLRSAVVFFDPDNGIAPPGARSRRRVGGEYVTLGDVGGVLDHMDESSIAIIYQHRPLYARAVPFYAQVAKELAEDLVGADVLYVAYGSLAFFIVTRSAARRREIEGIRGRLVMRQSRGWFAKHRYDPAPLTSLAPEST